MLVPITRNTFSGSKMARPRCLCGRARCEAAVGQDGEAGASEREVANDRPTTVTPSEMARPARLSAASRGRAGRYARRDGEAGA